MWKCEASNNPRLTRLGFFVAGNFDRGRGFQVDGQEAENRF